MEHDHKRFDLELVDLRAGLDRMGDLVVRQIEGALTCLANHDARGAQAIIEDDIRVNRMDIELEEVCLQLLALHHPVASDLRLITAVMKITTELERVGDRVVNICEAVHDCDEAATLASHREISRIGMLAAAMVRESLAAFSQADGALARRVIDHDKEFDVLYGDLFPRLLAVRLENDPTGSAHDARLALLSRDLNEISEHATNIAELVTFMVGGKELSHMDMHERRALR